MKFPMFQPITTDIMELFRKWGVDPDENRQLISDLMRFVYDEKMAVVETYNDTRTAR